MLKMEREGHTIAVLLTALKHPAPHRADATQLRLKLSDPTRFSWGKNWGRKKKSVPINYLSSLLSI